MRALHLLIFTIRNNCTILQILLCTLYIKLLNSHLDYFVVYLEFSLQIYIYIYIKCINISGTLKQYRTSLAIGAGYIRIAYHRLSAYYVILAVSAGGQWRRSLWRFRAHTRNVMKVRLAGVRLLGHAMICTRPLVQERQLHGCGRTIGAESHMQFLVQFFEWIHQE